MSKTEATTEHESMHPEADKHGHVLQKIGRYDSSAIKDSEEKTYSFTHAASQKSATKYTI